MDFWEGDANGSTGYNFGMIQKYYRCLCALLFLTFVLFPSIRIGAQPEVPRPVTAAADLVEIVNTLRISRGLVPYIPNEILSSIAQSHAAYISSTSVLTHFDQQGKRPYQRALDAGYPVAGELSAGGLFMQVIYSGAGVSEGEVISAWQVNAADSVAILSSEYEDVGVGIAAANGITYYVLIAASQNEASTTPTPITGTGTPTLLAGNGLPNTPLPDGEVYHTVQKDEALWSIALAYNTTIAQLKLLNNLAADEIFEGQRLLIRRANTATPTSTDVPVTATLGLSTSTPTLPVTPTVTNTPTPLPTPPATLQNGGAVLGGIVIAALVFAGLFAFLGRRRQGSAE